MATVFDERLGIYIEMRRSGVYYGATADDARAQADKAEARRVTRSRTPQVERTRYTMLSGVARVVKGE